MINVIGLGYIGLPTALMLAAHGVEVVGTDAFAGWTSAQTITIHIPLEQANNLWGEGWNGGATVIVK